MSISITLDCPARNGEITIQIGIDMDGLQDAIYLCPRAHVVGVSQFANFPESKVGYYVDSNNPCMVNTINQNVYYGSYPDMDNFIISRSFSELSDSTFYTRDAPGLDWFAMDMGITGDVVRLRAVDMDTKEVLAIVLIYIEKWTTTEIITSPNLKMAELIPCLPG